MYSTPNVQAVSTKLWSDIRKPALHTWERTALITWIYVYYLVLRHDRGLHNWNGSSQHLPLHKPSTEMSAYSSLSIEDLHLDRPRLRIRSRLERLNTFFQCVSMRH